MLKSHRNKPGRKPAFDAVAAADLRLEHEAGESVRVLAAKHGTCFSTVKRAIQLAGGTVAARPRAAKTYDVRFPGVLAVARTLNRKLGDCSATFVAAQTCPAACPFLGAGCYAEYDQTALHWKPITEQAAGMTAAEVARAEAAAIAALPAVRDLRLHVAGDSPTREGTRAIAEACEGYVARGLAVGKRLAVWAYTHAFRSVLRSDWWHVSILASCETAADVRAAWRRGYAAAVTVPAFPAGAKAFALGDGPGAVKCVPCPAQTGDAACVECRLCLDDRRLLATRMVIAFEVHGGGRKRATETLGRIALPVMQGDV